MPAQNERRAQARLERIAIRIEGLQFLHVKTTISIVERIDDKPTVVETRDDLDLLIDPVRQTRKLRHEAKDIEAWDRAAATAKLLHIKISCYREQLDALLADGYQVFGALCGNRAGKSQILAWWIFRRWMLRGGRNHAFWWLAPSWDMTQIAVDKFCRGDEKTPPIFPPELVTYFPKNHHQMVQAIMLVDGSYISLKPCFTNGDNIKGRAPHDIGIDEITSIRDRRNYTIALARLIDHGGMLGTASTPVAGHWSHGDIIVRAQASDRVAHFEFSCFQNPWNDPEVIRGLIEASGGEDDPVVRREYFGEWVPDGAALWPDFKPDQHLINEPSIDTIAGLVDAGYLPKSYRDITHRVASRFWRDVSNSSAQVVAFGGQDFNVWPCSTVLAKAFGDPRDPSTWGLFFFEEVLTRGSIQNHADVLSERWHGIPLSCDSTGALVNHGTQSQGISGSNTNVKELRKAGFLAQPCNRFKGKASNPRQIDTLNLCYRLLRRRRILVHTRCDKTMEAIYTQEREPDGRIKKDPNTVSDRRSGPTDCLRYLTWSLFKDEMRNAPKEAA